MFLFIVLKPLTSILNHIRLHGKSILKEEKKQWRVLIDDSIMIQLQRHDVFIDYTKSFLSVSIEYIYHPVFCINRKAATDKS